MADRTNEELLDQFDAALSEYLEKPNSTYEAALKTARAAVLARMVSPGHVRFPQSHQEAVAMVAICERMFPDSVPRMAGPGEVVVPKEPTLEMCNRGFAQIDPKMENAHGVPLARRIYLEMINHHKLSIAAVLRGPQ